MKNRISRTAVIAAGALLLFLAPVVVPAQTTEQILTPQTFIDVARKALPAVVSIEVEVPPSQDLLDANNANSMEELLRRFMLDPDANGLDRQFWDRLNRGDFGANGAGSGVIIDRRGDWAYVVTNNHVLERSSRVIYTITLDSSYSEFETIKVTGEDVEVIGNDPLTDLAVLRFRVPDGAEVPVLEFADSRQVQVGEWVLALGNPLELNNSVSQGIISAKNRQIGKTGIEELLQTTAVINPGNSGGPLVNLQGQIVGINNAIATTTGRWAGVGFAIPSNQAERVSDMLIEHGRVKRGYMGIRMWDLQGAFGLPNDAGVIVMDVLGGTPAAESGLQISDIIVRIEGKRITNIQDVHSMVGNRNAGDVIRVDILRFRGSERTEHTLDIALAERPEEDALVERRPRSEAPSLLRPPASGNPLEGLGMTVEPATVDGEQGLRVTDVERRSSAALAGIREGDVLININGLAIAGIEDLDTALGNIEQGRDHVVIYKRDGENRLATISQPD